MKLPLEVVRWKGKIKGQDVHLLSWQCKDGNVIIRLNGMSDRMGCGGSRPNGVLGWMVVEVVDGDVSSMVVVGLVMAAFRWILRSSMSKINIFSYGIVLTLFSKKSFHFLLTFLLPKRFLIGIHFQTN